MPVLFALAIAATVPTAEAHRLGRILAEQGTLASLLPLMKTKETDELVQEDPHLSASEQSQLRITADRVFKASYERLMDATGNAYAQQLNVEDLRALTRFYASPLAGRYRAATPVVIVATMKGVGQIDFKGDVRKAFCAERQRLCGN